MALIQLENVNLSYPIKGNHITFKEFILRGLFRRTFQKKTMVHALKDVSLTIRDGERVGIIGHNGAGKSTLLRTIAGIYPVADGIAAIAGEICSLFDINVGFEMDATGIRNIYFRSYLYGATTKSVAPHVPGICEFAELGEFIDLPINCYSSGMLIRLAFAIATATNPEILLIDEFFGAGDLAFQKKAEKRIKDLIGSARIVIMVGHNLDYLRKNCERIIWMHHGSVRADGDPNQIIDAYIAESDPTRQVAKAA